MDNDVVKLPANVAKKYECTITQPVIITTGDGSERIDLRNVTMAQASELVKRGSTALVLKKKTEE